ncbi:trimethyllysine dioxygenase TmlH [Aspergillus terreus]|uniref:trimethyllysine dioxygenase n=1 Tax=Aspergillus terreus TaxID=33178 RepID=A0A5M3YW87_ASPTE|nr:hypothetical protein ATETN484_0005020200 [Aspergillus terreus]GFF16867.1 trimethyllysine dioxygenase TmlH [Aspergillus terreus]
MSKITSTRALRSLKYLNLSNSWSTQLAPGSRCLPTNCRPSIVNAPRQFAFAPTRTNSSIATHKSGRNRQHVFEYSPNDYASAYTYLKSSPTSQEGPFGTFWLRDSCQCSKCIHPDTRQRAVDTFSIPRDVSVNDIQYNEGGAEVQYGHRGVYPYSFLSTHFNSPKHSQSKVGYTHSNFRPFKSHDPASKDYPTVAYTDVMSSDEGLFEWLEKIYVWGFCFVKGVPVDPESTKTLIERIAFIRHTHYGGFWDFTADLTFKDTAYTTEFLGAHTDNTYFTDPARLQLFHLLSHTDGAGGESLLVDGFQAAARMRAENPSNLGILQNETQPYHSSGNEDVCILPASMEPVVKVHKELNRIYQIRWNNYDRAAKRDWDLHRQNRWYNAAHHWNNIITRPNMEIWTQLEPGTALIFDNWRMMHGRSEFTGKRRMCGGYTNNDDFISKYRLLKFGREKVLENLGNTFVYKDNPFYYI